MGRKKIEIQKIEDDRIRRVTFKKRRIGLLKKAIQLSKLTNARVMLKVYHEEDGSLIEYYSDSQHDLDAFNQSNVAEYSKFTNKHYDLLAQVEDRINKNGFANNFIKNDFKDLEKGIEIDQQQKISMISLFSLAKKSSSKLPDDLENSVISPQDMDDEFFGKPASECTFQIAPSMRETEKLKSSSKKEVYPNKPQVITKQDASNQKRRTKKRIQKVESIQYQKSNFENQINTIQKPKRMTRNNKKLSFMKETEDVCYNKCPDTLPTKEVTQAKEVTSVFDGSFDSPECLAQKNLMQSHEDDVAPNLTISKSNYLKSMEVKLTKNIEFRSICSLQEEQEERLLQNQLKMAPKDQIFDLNFKNQFEHQNQINDILKESQMPSFDNPVKFPNIQQGIALLDPPKATMLQLNKSIKTSAGASSNILKNRLHTMGEIAANPMCSTVQIRRYSDEIILKPNDSDGDSAHFENTADRAFASTRAQKGQCNSQIQDCFTSYMDQNQM